MINDPRIVSSFRNADMKYADPPESFEGCVGGDSERVEDLLARLNATESDDTRVKTFQAALVSNVLTEDLTGIYSTYADVAAYMWGELFLSRVPLVVLIKDLVRIRSSGNLVLGIYVRDVFCTLILRPHLDFQVLQRARCCEIGKTRPW